MDRDGIVERRTAGASPGRILAIGLTAIGALFVLAWLLLRVDGPPPRAAAVASAPEPPPDPAPAPLPRAPPPAARAGAAEIPPAAAAGTGAGAPDAPGGEPAPVAEGMALFPPMGTKPIQRGILVPEDFELPPGFVRHHQATDDGERVPAILKFHPDHQPVDGLGRPVPMPPDGIVPPELAPPGLPLEFLELPGDPGDAESP